MASGGRIPRAESSTSLNRSGKKSASRRNKCARGWGGGRGDVYESDARSPWDGDPKAQRWSIMRVRAGASELATGWPAARKSVNRVEKDASAQGRKVAFEIDFARANAQNRV